MTDLLENDDWLEIRDPDVDAAEVAERVRERMAAREDLPQAEGSEKDPRALVDDLRRQMIDRDTNGDGLPIDERDCDVVPRNYVIDWRVPILGPVHALVRRLINAEIRRYLMPALEKQSYLNRQMLRLLDDLLQENKRLVQEIDELRGDRR